MRDERTPVFYWLLKYVVLGPVLKALFRPRVDGLAHVPGTGPVILACNHLSFSDSIFTPLIVKRRVTFVAKAEYFTGKGIKGWLMRQFFLSTGTIPVDRSGGKAAQAALDTLLRVLRDGDVAGIYPEGTRSPDGRMYRGRTGIARIVLEANVPVIPIAMMGTDKVQPIGSRFPRLGHSIGVRVGPALDYSALAAGPRNPKLLREVTDDIMAHIRRLSGQQYVDKYASREKDRS
jgi:1-acyl-sn-glycerol-3-phosphate acyltransferase